MAKCVTTQSKMCNHTVQCKQTFVTGLQTLSQHYLTSSKYLFEAYEQILGDIVLRTFGPFGQTEEEICNA